MQVTISLLPVSLSLVHIPRSRLDSLSRPILRQILHPSPPGFLNITCNEIELSVFAESRMVRHFEPVARRDRRRMRVRMRRGAVGEDGGEGKGGSKGKGKGKEHEPVEISSERWSVLQIDSHSDQIDNSGTRVYDLSAPLAAAGISILYQSSYMSDFIFVKEARLKEAMDLFASAGFDVYTAADDDRSDADFNPSSDTEDLAHTPIPPPSTATASAPTTDSHPAPNKKPKSHSPTSGEVRILHPDLACVGLSDELGVDHWGLKIVKLVAFPDLIPASPRASATTGSGSRSRAGSGSYPSSPVNTKIKTKIDAEESEITGSSSSSSPSSSGSSSYSSLTSSSSSSSCSSNGDDDGYFSHSPRNISAASLSGTPKTTTTPILSPAPTREARASAIHGQRIHADANGAKGSSRPSPSQKPSRTHTHSPSQKPNPPPAPSQQTPFFSFTRTPEGSSLTADVHVLAMLFPKGERHMVICSGELDVADRFAEGVAEGDSLREWGEEGEEGEFGEDGGEEDGGGEGEDREEEEEEDSASRSLKCLQIDLRRFGLDKHGLVTRFSRVLEENGINHMYSSTFKTANLLVDKRHARRAQSLLRAC